MIGPYQILLILIVLAIVIFSIISLWKLFEKAGQPGWAAIIPFYNIYILTQMAEKPGWWTLLMIIPYVNIIFSIWVWNRIIKRFGKDEGFTVGVVLLGIVFIAILAFGDSEYKAEGIQTAEGDDLLDNDLDLLS